jgi:ADP-heptose:LPS heptosyltransferase
MDKIMWSEVFENNPKITKSRAGCAKLVNGPGLRPYIAGKDTYRWQWRRLRSQQPGEIFLTAEEAAFGQQHGGKIMIEPNVKANGHWNKAWPFDRWQELVRGSSSEFVQVGFPATRWLDGVERVETPTFRMACAVLAASKAFVGTEGALHHAAAALSVPAVALALEKLA